MTLVRGHCDLPLCFPGTLNAYFPLKLDSSLLHIRLRRGTLIQLLFILLALNVLFQSTALSCWLVRVGKESGEDWTFYKSLF